MAFHHTVQHRTVQVCVCVAVLLLLLAGHTATLAYSYIHGEHGDGRVAALQLLVGGAVLWTVLPLLALGCLVPDKAALLCKVWFAVHVTWTDDTATHAVKVLANLQVRPVLDAVGLTAHAAASVESLDFWWWFLQGLLLTALVSSLADATSPREDESGEEELAEVVVEVDGRGSLAGREEEARLDMPDLLAICYDDHPLE